MALSPGIPTSFVPKQPVQNQKRHTGGTNFLLVGAISVLALALLSAAGVFAYDRYLTYVKDAKAAELAKAQQSVDQDTVQGFVRLRNRFVAGKLLLNNHVVVSQLFTALENVTLQNVRYNSLNVHVAGDRTATVEIGGTARNFNTLAAQSNTLASSPRFRRAIFSGITLNKDNTVNFRLTADVDSKLVLIPAAGTAAPAALPAAAPITVQATTTPTIVPTATTATTTTARGATTTPRTAPTKP